jgi:hypothetical protein
MRRTREERLERFFEQRRLDELNDKRFHNVNEMDRKRVGKVQAGLLKSLEDVKVWVQDPGSESCWYKTVWVTPHGCVKFDSFHTSFVRKSWLKDVLSYSDSYRLAEPMDVLKNWQKYRLMKGRNLERELIEKWLPQDE